MNQPAFPVFVEPTQQEKMIGRGPVQYLGMTMRDYFAAKAMQGICAHGDTWGLTDCEIARRAYLMADEMLKAREA